MVKLVFLMLVILLSSSVGLAIAVAELYRRLYKVVAADNITRSDAFKARGAVKLGIAFTNAVLLYAVGVAGTTQVSLRTWLYLVGLSIITVGLGFEATALITQLARADAVAGVGEKSLESNHRHEATQEVHDQRDERDRNVKRFDEKEK